MLSISLFQPSAVNAGDPETGRSDGVPPSDIPSVRSLIDRRRVGEMLAAGWVVIDDAPPSDAEWACLMQGPDPDLRPARPFARSLFAVALSAFCPSDHLQPPASARQAPGEDPEHG